MAKPRFFYIVKDSVRRYQDDVAVAFDWTAELFVETDYQYALAYCGHNHRDPDRAKECGERMLRKVESGEYPEDFCLPSPTHRHLVRSDDTCVYCDRAIETSSPPGPFAARRA